MDVTVRIPDSKNSMDSAVLRQFSDIQKSMLKLIDAQTTSKKDLHKMVASHSDSLVDAMDKMMAMMQKVLTNKKPEQVQSPSFGKLEDALTSLIKQMGKLKQTQSSSSEKPSISVSPKVTVTMPDSMLKKFDSLQETLAKGFKKSRSTTFGSNY